ncbi:MATE family efflux transporter [Lachnospiraceae bacterium NSJ-143]|nr:MATE family efflux transporter [Lachnospiraceae bacterium NSJ-143]
MGKKNEVDMINGPLMGKIIVFVIPVILSGVLQLLFNAADIVVVGRYAGSDSLAAVGSTTSIVNLLVNFFIGISIGANAVTARLIGVGSKSGIEETVHTAMVTSVISGLILVFVGFIFTRPLLVAMGSPENVLNKSALYLRIYFAGMPATMLYNFGSAILRAFGDTKRPLIYLSIGGVINVVLNLFLVIVFKMDVAGVGIATVVAQCIAAVLVLRRFLSTDELYRLDRTKLKINKHRLLQMFRVGVPAGLQSVVFNIANVIIQSSVNSFGAVVMAGNASATSIEGILFTAMNSFNQAGLTFTSQNLGAKKIKRIKKVLIDCVLLVIIVGIIVGGGMYITSDFLLGIYSKDPEVMRYASMRFTLMCATYFICGAMDTTTGVLRGMGYSFFSMCISLICVCGIRLLFVFTYFQTHRTYFTLFLSYPLSWIAAFAVEMVLFVYGYRKLIRANPENDIFTEAKV